jgi:hypothetical protein
MPELPRFGACHPLDPAQGNGETSNVSPDLARICQRRGLEDGRLVRGLVCYPLCKLGRNWLFGAAGFRVTLGIPPAAVVPSLAPTQTFLSHVGRLGERARKG